MALSKTRRAAAALGVDRVSQTREVTDALAIEQSTTDAGQPLLTLRGELDVASCSALEEVLTAVVGPDTPTVVVDLAGVPFMDSSGFGALLAAHRAGASIVVRSPSRQVRDLLKLVAVPGVVDVEG